MASVELDRQVVFTNKARCRDCYRCVRVCPVKAIRMHDGQAAVVEERCIGCGTCVRECPQRAKSIRGELDRVRRLLASGARVAASIAPSFAAVYPQWHRRRLVSALRRLGFAYVGETAIGAYYTAKEMATIVEEKPNRSHIGTACPALVRYIERYRPELVSSLLPVVSPMLAHARHIKDRLGEEVRVVFVGPCSAKKAEAQRPEHAGLVDAALTFVELAEWLACEEIRLDGCEESDFDEAPAGPSRLFALEGGCVKTAGWSTDLLAGDVVAVSGYEEICQALDSLGAGEGPKVLEPLFCAQGCINGPGMLTPRNTLARRSDVLRYDERQVAVEPMAEEGPGRGALRTEFSPELPNELPPAEAEIRRVLEMTGKARDEDQLNCGACGYASCRDKAIAVIRGLAEPEMCLPRMKRLAEQRVDRIIESSPNGIVILDDHLRILHMNPTFRRFFMCSDAVCGQPISYLMDPEPFERLASGQHDLVEMVAEHKRYNLVCHQILYPLREERQYVGVLVNITHSRANQEKLDHLRAQTVVQARELLDHQVRMAEELARLLGESTARGEALVEKLMVMADEEGEAGDRGERSESRGGRWLRDMYTSK